MATALVVDDEDSVRNVVVATLRRNGFQVLEADSVAGALQVAADFPGNIELVIVNHSLRDGTGLRIVERLRESRPDFHVIRYSGYSLEYLQSEGAILPGSAFLQKPFRAQNLMEKVREVLGELPDRHRTVGGGGS